MVTKDEERKALEKIKKIVEELGDDSYIGWAFKGCFEVAEKNIEYDYACSLDDLCETLQKENDSLKNDIGALAEEIKTKDALIEHERSMKRELDKELVFADGEIEKQSEIIEELNDVVERQDAEIIKLKARLYDLICEQ